MVFQMFVFLLVSFLILGLVHLCLHSWPHLQPSHSKGGAVRATVQRLLKPRTPLDCPICRLSSSGVRPAPAPVRPWSEVKSRRGAPKRVNTEGFSCPNRMCPYAGITDADFHASFWRWQAWPGFADPDLSLSGLPHHVPCSTPHALVPSENPFPSSRHGADCASLWVGSFGGLACLRLSTSHHHEPFSLAQVCTLRRCTLASFALCISHTCSWTNCAPDFGATIRCYGSG
jgi:hypothetical protein